MIDYNSIRRLRATIGVPEESIEKDYLVELLLGYLALNDFLESHLVFRGGTAIKKIYFPDFRYSEDLDFIVKPGKKLNDYEENINRTLNEIQKELPVELNIVNVSYPQKGHLQLFISYDIVPEILLTKELKIDIIEDNSVLPSKERKIVFSFSDFKKLGRVLNTYDLESISAEKILRIMDVVNEPRDLWDLLYLLKSGVRIEVIKESFVEKCGVNIDISSLLRAIKNPNYKKTWEARLKNQMPKLVEYEQIIRKLEILIGINFGPTSMEDN